jgi:hypothetical protein
MSLKPSDIDYIINLLKQITEALTKTDDYLWPQDMKDKLLLSMKKQKYVNSTIKPLQKKLNLYLTPRWPEILRLSDQRQFRQDIEVFLNIKDIDEIRRSRVDYLDDSILKNKKGKVVDELQCIKAKLEYQNEKPAETGQNATPAKTINIKNFKGILADDVQAEIVQTGDHSSTHKQTITGEKKEGIIRKILKIIVKVIGAIVIGIIVAIVIDILGDFGWLQSIKEFIYSSLPK